MPSRGRWGGERFPELPRGGVLEGDKNTPYLRVLSQPFFLSSSLQGDPAPSSLNGQAFSRPQGTPPALPSTVQTPPQASVLPHPPHHHSLGASPFCPAPQTPLSGFDLAAYLAPPTFHPQTRLCPTTLLRMSTPEPRSFEVIPSRSSPQAPPPGPVLTRRPLPGPASARTFCCPLET